MNNRIWIVVAVFTGLLSDCKKEGKYEAELLVYQTQESAQRYSNNGATELVVYLSARKMGSISAGAYYYADPVCGKDKPGSVLSCRINFTRSDESKNMSFELKDQNENLLDSRTVTVVASECNKLRLD